MRSPYTLLEPRAYLRDVTAKIRAAKRHVYVITMVLNDDETTHDFFEALGDAAARGVTVHVTADTYTYAELGTHVAEGFHSHGRIRNVIGMRGRLAEKGVAFHWLGTKSISFVAGRTHSKWVVVDDIIYSFGGVNIYAKAFEQTDYMFRATDPELAAQLVAEHERIITADRRGQVYRSHTFGDEKHTILVDGGAFGNSIIYHRACALARAAEKVTYVSQYCPTGKLSTHLKKVGARLYFNPWQTAQGANAIIIRIGEFFSGQTSSYTRETYLHAKFMIFDMPDGTRVALTGSHNFPRVGMWVGTREIALETTDKHIIAQLEKFLKKYVI